MKTDKNNDLEWAAINIASEMLRRVVSLFDLPAIAVNDPELLLVEPSSVTSMVDLCARYAAQKRRLVRLLNCVEVVLETARSDQLLSTRKSQ